MYHGRIDDSRELPNVKTKDFRAALDAVLAGQPVSVPTPSSSAAPSSGRRSFVTLLALLLAGAVAVTPLNEATTRSWSRARRAKLWWSISGPPGARPAARRCRNWWPSGKRQEANGVRLVAISADELSDGAKASAFLDAQHAPVPRFIKKADNDEKFIDAIDPKWSGALPATFVYDRTGKRVKSIFGELSMPDLERAVGALTR